MLSRTITGLIIIMLAIWFIVFVGFVDGPKIDYVAIIFGISFLFIGGFLLFNKKEDEIEKIKDQNKK